MAINLSDENEVQKLKSTHRIKGGIFKLNKFNLFNLEGCRVD